MLQPPARADARRLWEFFTGNGYTEEGLTRELGSSEPPSRVFRTLPLVLDRTRGGRPLDHLVRWFLCSLPIREEEIGESLPEWFLPVAEGAGLLARRDGAWRLTRIASTSRRRTSRSPGPRRRATRPMRWRCCARRGTRRGKRRSTSSPTVAPAPLRKTPG